MVNIYRGGGSGKDSQLWLILFEKIKILSIYIYLFVLGL